MKSKSISAETKAAILDVAWQLHVSRGRIEVPMTMIAAAAGVSRQTVFYAFGNRTGLLTAMLRHREENSPEVAELERLSATADPTSETLLAYVGAWLDYLPQIYPVGGLLYSAGVSDPAAQRAIDDRMVLWLLAGMQGLTRRLSERAILRENSNSLAVADQIWAAVHFPAWRLLVVEQGWSAELFRQSRLDYVRSFLRR